MKEGRGEKGSHRALSPRVVSKLSPSQSYGGLSGEEETETERSWSPAEPLRSSNDLSQPSQQIWGIDTRVIYDNHFAKLRFRKLEVTKLIKVSTGRRDRAVP